MLKIFQDVLDVFNQHYSGRVIVMQNEFEKILTGPEEGIKHKNYDEDIDKSDIDLMFTDDEFLNQNDKKRLENLFDEIRIRELPDSIFNTFKVISPFDKIFIYDQIKSMKKISDKSKSEKLNKAVKLYIELQT